jgi:hypothetical protein
LYVDGNSKLGSDGNRLLGNGRHTIQALKKMKNFYEDEAMGVFVVLVGAAGFVSDDRGVRKHPKAVFRCHPAVDRTMDSWSLSFACIMGAASHPGATLSPISASVASWGKPSDSKEH